MVKHRQWAEWWSQPASMYQRTQYGGAMSASSAPTGRARGLRPPHCALCSAFTSSGHPLSVADAYAFVFRLFRCKAEDAQRTAGEEQGTNIICLWFAR